MELSRRVRFRFLWINIGINIVAGTPERKMSFGRPKCRWKIILQLI
jgi:hypothetical protein